MKTDLLEKFLRESGPAARQMALGLVRDEASADELVQETAYRVLKGWKRFDRSRALEPWFLTTMRNAHMDRLRRSGRTFQLGGLDASGRAWGEDMSDGSPALDSSMERGEMLQALRRALASLTADHRKVLRACDIDGLTYAEASKRLRVNSGTVRSRLARARRALREAFMREA